MVRIGEKCGHRWLVAYQYYEEVSNQKILAPGGGTLGLDQGALTTLFDDYGLDPQTRLEYRWRIRCIDKVITQVYNDHVRSQLSSKG